MKQEKLTNQDIMIFVVLLIIFVLWGGYLAWFQPPHQLIQFFSTTSQKTGGPLTITSSDFDTSLFQMEQFKALKSYVQPLLPQRRQIPNNPFAPVNNQVNEY